MAEMLWREQEDGVLIAAVFASALLALTPAGPQPAGVAVAAHRGLAEGVPENTLAAFRHSLDQGVPILELDLRLTKDGQLVVLHDERLDRTTDCTGRVSELTLAEVRRCDAGWPTHSGERVPTFGEVLALVAERPAQLLVDVKDVRQLDPVLAAIRDEQAAGRVILGLRRTEDVARAHQLFPDMTLLAYMPRQADAAAFARAGAQIIRLWSDWVDEDPALLRRTRNLGPQVWIMVGRRLPASRDGWRALHGRMIAAGAQGLITDRPELIPAR